MNCNPNQLKARAVWVRALLSGDYQQGQEALCVREGDQLSYCCLGVAQHLFAPRWRGLGFEYDEGDGPECSREGALSGATRNRLGLSTHDQDVLMAWNDDAQWGFEQIARAVAYASSQGLTMGQLHDAVGWDEESGEVVYPAPEGFDVQEWLAEVGSGTA